MGLFDEKGTQLNGKGFRGWSGGARRSFEISESFATPGYIPGKIKAGEWNIVQMLVKDVPKVEWKLIVTIVIGKNKEKPFVPVYAKSRLMIWMVGTVLIHMYIRFIQMGKHS